MKHPVLTRVFSIVLIIMSLIMLVNGAVGIGKAADSKESDRLKYERLCTRISTYEQLSESLKGTVGYDEAADELAELQEAHRAQASQHRADLAEYSATRGGIEMGSKALNEADAALKKAKKQYESGVEMFEEGEKQFETLMSIYDKEAFDAQKKACADDAADCAAVEATIGQMLRMYQPTTGNDSTGAEETAASEEGQEKTSEETGAGEETGEGGDIKEESGTGTGDETGESSGGVSVNVMSLMMTYMGKLAKYQKTINNSIELIKPFASLAEGGEEMLSLLENADSSETEIDMTTIMSMPDDQKLNMMLGIFSSVKTGLIGMQDALQGVETGVEEGQQKLKESKEQLDFAGEQLESGEKQLSSGRAQINSKLWELKDTKTELEAEKAVLEDEAAELSEMEKKTEAQKELEKKHKSTRLNLMSYEEIGSRVENGGELVESAKDYADEFSKEYNYKYRILLIINILAIIGGIAGFIGLPAAFEKLKNRFMLIAPVVLCLGCAVSADLLNMHISLGQMYTALFTAIFAAIQLLIVCVDYKKKRT